MLLIWLLINSQSESHLAVSNSLRLHGLWPARLLCPWNSPGQNTAVGSHSLFQGIFPTQWWNPGLLHCRQILYHLSHQGIPVQFKEWELGSSKAGENTPPNPDHISQTDLSPIRTGLLEWALFWGPENHTQSLWVPTDILPGQSSRPGLPHCPKPPPLPCPWPTFQTNNGNISSDIYFGGDNEENFLKM